MKNYFDELLNRLWKCYEQDKDVTVSIKNRNEGTYSSVTIIPEEVKFDGSLYLEAGNNIINIDCSDMSVIENTIEKIDDSYIFYTKTNRCYFCF